MRLYDSAAQDAAPAVPSVVTGVVVNNCDLIVQGKVLVRIPSLNQEVWARLSGVGGGAGVGVFYNPAVDDEVLVALDPNDTANAYVVGGLWSTRSGPPVASVAEATTQRVIRTGLAGAVGHEVVFDDARQSITITSSTRQTIVVDPKKIEMRNTAGTLSVTLDNATQTLTLSGVNIRIEGTASVALSAPVVEVSSRTSTSVGSTGTTSVTGLPVRIN